MYMLILVCQGFFYVFLKDEIIKPEEEEEEKKKTTKTTKGKKGLKVKVSLCLRFSRMGVLCWIANALYLLVRKRRPHR